jgi:hypothetical protein
MADKWRPEYGPWLCRLADPDAKAFVPDIDAIPAISAAALAHGVGSIVYRKLAGKADGGCVSVLKGQAETLTAMTMLLTLVATRIRAEIGSGAAAAIVKGPVFAAKLYNAQSDRPYTDIDILVAPSAQKAVEVALARAGFQRLRKAVLDHSSAYEEQKWVHPEMPTVLVELHGNLVHYPALRRKVSFGHAQLLECGAGDGEAPLALFFTAVVHASLGHKFHQLRMLVDVLQAWRNLRPPERQLVASLTRSLNLELETGLCLKLISTLFGDFCAGEFAASLTRSSASRFASMLVDAPTVVAAPYSGMSRMRRNAFRLAQYLAKDR